MNMTEWKEILEKDNITDTKDKDSLLPALIVAGIFEKGDNKAQVMNWIGKIAKEKPTQFNTMWANLEKNGTFEDGKVVVSKDFDENSGIEFTMLILVAQGLLERAKK